MCPMDGSLIRVALIGVLLLITPTIVLVNGNFLLTVSFINYTNPTGLCAECNGGLEAFDSADQLTPVCCDESPFRTDNCDNTGEARCDTRFRWTIRPFGASLETRPVSEPNAPDPPYYFTDCDLPNATCPFSEMSTTFSKGQTGFLGVAANPLLVIPKTLTKWSGSIQFFIEALDSGLPNIIDSLLINLDNLQLGADFTEEMTFTGYHNISHMTMSFGVTCQTGFCGRDCTAARTSNPRILSCNSTDGDIVCEEKYDPSANCNKCFYNLDSSTDCSTCLKPNFDPDTNCTACLPGYDRNTNCSTCLNTNYDPSANCTTCLPSYDPVTNCTTCLDSLFDPDNNCTSCLLEGNDPLTNCTQCLPNRDPSTNCTQCSPGWDISSDCMTCLTNRDPSTNCTQCLPNYDPSKKCSTCLPGWNISSECMTCLSGKDLSTNCTQCLPNRDPSTDCSTCLFGFDINRDCSVCLPGRDISTSCTTCLSGYDGENCMSVTGTSSDSSLSAALVGGVAGGVGGSLLLVIIVLVVIVGVLVCQVRRRGHAKFNVSDGAVTNAYLGGGETGTGSSVEHKFQNPIYGPGQELDSKPGAGTGDNMFTNSMYELSKVQRDVEYSQLHRPSASPPTHQAKTGTSEMTGVYDSANYQDESQPKEGTPVYDTADHRDSSQPPISKGSTPQESYARLRQPTETSITLQPVPPTPLEAYDTPTFTDKMDQPVYEDLPPVSEKTRHPSKSPASYEEIDKDLNLSSGSAPPGVYDKAYPTPSGDDPSANAYSELEELINVYSTIDGPTNTYSAPEGPTEDYSELSHPAKAITKPSKFNRSGSNYSKINEHAADAELPTYDVSIHGHPQTQPQTLPPHAAALYDTANYPSEPTPQHDYAETADFIGPTSDSSPSNSVKPHSYDYVDTPLDSEGGTSSVPPAVDPRVRAVYTNTMPGKVTPEAESHYDLGQ